MKTLSTSIACAGKVRRIAMFSAILLSGSALTPAFGQFSLINGDLVVSKSVYSNTGVVSTLNVGDSLPDSKNGGTPFKAIASGSSGYPFVFDNDQVDSSFGVTAQISLDQFSLGASGTTATLANSLAISPSVAVTSFPSKSELALNVSTDGNAITFMGYQAAAGALDISNSGTPYLSGSNGEPGNFVTSGPAYREVIQVNRDGSVSTTTSNAYAGNNGRAAILDSADNQYLTVGNGGNGNGSLSIAQATGVQIITPGSNATSSAQGTTVVGVLTSGTTNKGVATAQYGFSVTQTNPSTGVAYSGTNGMDKYGKDNNFRGETIYGNTLFVTKGSGGNGINTVYQVGSAGTLPTAATASSTVINPLPGLPTFLASTGTSAAYPQGFYPFGIWFANKSTLYIADEGDGTVANAGSDLNSGLEKWTLAVSGTWQKDYTLQSGLNLGQTYTVAGYPTGDHTVVTGTTSKDLGNWSPETDGLRNITGQTNQDGTVTIFGVTSTVSGSGDPGADPNAVVAIVDNLSATSLPTGESFNTLDGPSFCVVYRGVAEAVPEPSTWIMPIAAALGFAVLSRQRSKAAKA